MKSYLRYAIYYAPREGQLLDTLEAWLGRSARAGVQVTPALVAGGYDVAELTEAPRRYGAHATLKAPFRLAEGARADDLHAALATYAARTPQIALAALELSQLGSFFALTPVGDTQALSAFAFDIVQHFHGFTAPLTAAEIAKRRPERLSLRQRELLAQWSYPHVAEEFRFHVTLTGKVDADCGARLRPELISRFTPVLPRPFLIEDLCLFGEEDSGEFTLVDRLQLMR